MVSTEAPSIHAKANVEAQVYMHLHYFRRPFLRGQGDSLEMWKYMLTLAHASVWQTFVGVAAFLS